MKVMSFSSRSSISYAVAGLLFVSPHIVTAATIEKNEDLFINIGGAFRTSFSSVEDAAPNGDDRSSDITVEEARLYTNGKVHKNVTFELNIARNRFNNADYDSNDVEILDASLGIQLSENVNILAGRILPPSSRASAAAPLYSTTFDFPIAESAVVGSNLQFGGRDDGVTLWGTDSSKKFKYQVGAFTGRDGDATSSNQSDNLAYATRVQYNVWDAEPGFYNVASYDGSKSILSFGASYKFQEDGAGTIANAGDYQYWNVDVRLEKPLQSGAVLGFEASYYDYDNDGTQDLTVPEATGYFVTASYTFPQNVGIGRIQPRVVVQNVDNVTADTNVDQYDVGFGYLIDGSNIRIDTFYFRQSPSTGEEIDGFKIIFHLAKFI